MDSKWIVLLVNMVFESLHDNIVLPPGYCPAHTQAPRWAAITVTLNWHWYSVDYQTRLENFMMQCKPVSSLSMIRLKLVHFKVHTWYITHGRVEPSYYA